MSWTVAPLWAGIPARQQRDEQVSSATSENLAVIGTEAKRKLGRRSGLTWGFPDGEAMRLYLRASNKRAKLAIVHHTADGDPAGSRTQNTRLKRPVLCQLSYRVTRTEDGDRRSGIANGGIIPFGVFAVKDSRREESGG